jgi:hypothetical protein
MIVKGLVGTRPEFALIKQGRALLAALLPAELRYDRPPLPANLGPSSSTQNSADAGGEGAIPSFVAVFVFPAVAHHIQPNVGIGIGLAFVEAAV